MPRRSELSREAWSDQQLEQVAEAAMRKVVCVTAGYPATTWLSRLSDRDLLIRRLQVEFAACSHLEISIPERLALSKAEERALNRRVLAQAVRRVAELHGWWAERAEVVLAAFDAPWVALDAAYNREHGYRDPGMDPDAWPA